MLQITLYKLLISLIALLFVTSNAIAEDNANAVEYKLTLSHYDTQNLHANDANIRVSQNNQTVWVGLYKENTSNFEQVRVGYERTDMLPYTKLVSSIQAADYGFWGGAITAEIGKTFYAILGYARTNLKPYDNINFDPNDAITYGAGWHGDNDFNISLYTVRDNRVVPGQQITHFLVRKPVDDNQKIILDIYSKDGPNDLKNQAIAAVGASVTYDWPVYFVRLAYDPKVNFSQDNMTRLSLGIRF